MFQGLTFFGLPLEWFLRAAEACVIGSAALLVVVWLLAKLPPVRRWWRIQSTKWAHKWLMKKWGDK